MEIEVISKETILSFIQNEYSDTPSSTRKYKSTRKELTIYFR